MKLQTLNKKQIQQLFRKGHSLSNDLFAIKYVKTTKETGVCISFSKKLNRLMVITRGEKGAVAINGDEVFENGIQKNLKIIDLTGAGDLFAAGFLHGYINKLATKECLKKGTEMSSKVIQQIGARL